MPAIFCMGGFGSRGKELAFESVLNDCNRLLPVFLLFFSFKNSMSAVNFERRICCLLYLASWKRITTIFTFHKFVKKKKGGYFLSAPTHFVVSYWQLHIWVSCHISPESRRPGRRGMANEWDHWLRCSWTASVIAFGGLVYPQWLHSW